MNTYKFAALVISYDTNDIIVADIAQTKEGCLKKRNKQVEMHIFLEGLDTADAEFLRKQYNKESVCDLAHNIEFRVSKITNEN